ncbi:MAG: sensor histidine kinase [Spirochaetales bacterium]|nr:sensor histidine kinase [Spirochaetales bacterium]
MILLISFFVMLGFILIRLPEVFIRPNNNFMMNSTGIQSYFIIIWNITISAWPIGFSLLISHKLQINAQIQNIEKSILLKELYHRTKNNMQVISSYIELQQSKTTSSEVKKELHEIETLIQSIALVHNKLYQAKNLSHIQLNDYVEDLLKLLINSYKDTYKKIIISTHIDPIFTTIDIAIPLGLIINELITNSLKYAFDKKEGTIFVEIIKEGNTLNMTIKDNGKGIPAEYNIYNTDTIGINTVINLVEKQLSGTITFYSNNGFCCYIQFPFKDTSSKIDPFNDK